MDSLIIVLAVTMFNMYGIPYSGVDLCGFISVAFKELCTRWMQMGVFFPLGTFLAAVVIELVETTTLS